MLESLADLLGGAQPAAPLDLAPFLAGMPMSVRVELERAQHGQGVLVRWYRGHANARAGGRIRECITLANRRDVSAEIYGWLVGITCFDDDEQLLGLTLRRPSHRDPAIAPALEALAVGIASGRPATPRLWATVEALANRVEALPPALGSIVPVGLVSKLATIRGIALRLGHRLGAVATIAIESARAHAAASDATVLGEGLVTLAGGPPVTTSVDDVALLARLLAAWRTTRDVALEGPIARLGAEVARARGPLVARSKTELEGAWLALAGHRDPADVDRLLDAPWPSTWKAAAARVKVLREFPPDPRLARRLVILARRYSSRQVMPLYREVTRVVIHSATRSVLPDLDALSAEADRMHDDHYSWRGMPRPFNTVYRAIESIESTPADPALLAEAAQRIGGALEPGNELEALYAEHTAHPGDLAARAVLADALQLAGDPRGEFIALQLAIAAGTADATAVRRADALLAQHVLEWIGPLPGVRASTSHRADASVRFERGFLVAAETTARQDLLERSLGRREWCTVEELSLPTHDMREIGALVRRMPLLRKLAGRERTMQSLERSDAPFPGIRVLFTNDAYVPRPQLLPDLEVLGVRVWATDPRGIVGVQRAAAALGIRALVYFGIETHDFARVLGSLGAAPPELRFSLSDWTSGFSARDTWVMRLLRDDPTTLAIDHRSGVPLWEPARRLFDSLTSVGIRRLAVHPRHAHHEYFATLGLELVEGPPIELAD